MSAITKQSLYVASSRIQRVIDFNELRVVNSLGSPPWHHLMPCRLVPNHIEVHAEHISNCLDSIRYYYGWTSRTSDGDYHIFYAYSWYGWGDYVGSYYSFCGS